MITKFRGKPATAENVCYYRYSSVTNEYAVFENCNVFNDRIVFSKGNALRTARVCPEEAKVRMNAGYFLVWLYEPDDDFARECIRKAIIQYVDEQTTTCLKRITYLMDKYKDIIEGTGSTDMVHHTS